MLLAKDGELVAIFDSFDCFGGLQVLGSISVDGVDALDGGVVGVT